jgi:N-acylglucosamine-6-phosphate 2-epimerase
VVEKKDERLKLPFKKGLIVSCQAYPGDPLYGAGFMAAMAQAAQMGGAVAVRAQGIQDIKAIQAKVKLPLIGIIKKSYPGSSVYITATQQEVKALIRLKPEVIALDGTLRRRPRAEKLKDLIGMIHSGGSLVMADVSTLEEGLESQGMGADIISTTLSGYTSQSGKMKGPDLVLLKKLIRRCRVPVIGEGRFETPRQVEKAMRMGAYAVVIGGAITIPQAITRKFAKAAAQGIKN